MYRVVTQTKRGNYMCIYVDMYVCIYVCVVSVCTRVRAYVSALVYIYICLFWKYRQYAQYTTYINTYTQFAKHHSTWYICERLYQMDKYNAPVI